MEAVLQPAYAFLILAALSLPWHKYGLSCGIRALCDAKNAASDRLSARMQSKRLKVRWNGEGVLIKGTWAKVVAKSPNGPKPTAQAALRTAALARCNPAQVSGWARIFLAYNAISSITELLSIMLRNRTGRDEAVARCQVLVASSTLAASAATDFELLDTRQLRRLLRMANIPTTGQETPPELLQKLRFHSDCDDSLFDNAKMPAKLQRYQLLQAGLHLLMCVAKCERHFNHSEVEPD